MLFRHYVQSIFAGLNNYLQESSEYNYQVKIETLTNTYNNQTASFGDKFLTLFTCNENLDYKTMVIAKRV